MEYVRQQGYPDERHPATRELWTWERERQLKEGGETNHVNTNGVGSVVSPEGDLSQDLVGQGARHDERRVTGGTPKVDKSTCLSKQIMVRSLRRMTRIKSKEMKVASVFSLKHCFATHACRLTTSEAPFSYL